MMRIAAHPGEILREELDERGLSLSELARQIDVPPGRLSEIVNGKRAVTGDTALRLGHWFGTDPQFWMNLQVQFDLARAAAAAGDRIKALPTAE